MQCKTKPVTIFWALENGHLHVMQQHRGIWAGDGVSCMPQGKIYNWEYRCEKYFKLLLVGFRHILNIDCGVKC